MLDKSDLEIGAEFGIDALRYCALRESYEECGIYSPSPLFQLKSGLNLSSLDRRELFLKSGGEEFN